MELESIIKNNYQLKKNKTMKTLRRVLFAIAILSTTGLATSCFDNSDEVFGTDETTESSSTVPDESEEKWD